MDKQDDKDRINISSITQAAVGYVRDNSASKKMAERFVAQVRVQLGQILAERDIGKESPLGEKATPEAVALMEYITEKRDQLKADRGYAKAQASAIVLKDELAPLQMVAGMANDSEMIASIRKVNAQVITELGEKEEITKEDIISQLRRKKRGRQPGSGKKKPEENK